MNIFFGLSGTQILIICLVAYAVVAGVITFKLVHNKTLVGHFDLLPTVHKIAFSIFGFAILPWMGLAMVFVWLGNLGRPKDQDEALNDQTAEYAVQSSGLAILLTVLYLTSFGIAPMAVLTQNPKADTACVSKK